MANKFVTFDGAAGSYISCDDVNMYDADTAHVQQGLGIWLPTARVDALVLSSVIAPPFGTQHVDTTVNDTGDAVVSAGVTGSGTEFLPIVPLTEYSFSVYVARSTPGDIRVAGSWRTSSGGFAGSTVAVTLTAAADTWTLFEIAGETSPSNAVRFVLQTVSENVSAGVKMYVSTACVRIGPVATFIPSLDIVGTLGEVLDPPGFPVAYVKDQDLRLGVSYTGDIVDYQRLDGTSGPVVARMDADEIPFADGPIADLSTWTDSSGRVWTSHGNVILSTVGGGVPIDVTFTEAGVDTDPFSTTSLAFRTYTEAGVDTDLFDAVLDVPGAVALTFTEASTDVDSFSALHVVPPPPVDPDDPISETPIPPGTTWTDSTGRVWTSFGSLVMQDDSVQTVRQELIKFLRLHHSNWQFYDYPPEVLSTPAVLINPSDPYIEPFTQGPDGPSAVIWGIDLTLVTKRAQPQSSLLTLEFMFTSIQETLRLRPNIRWIDFSDVGSIEVAGVTYLSGVLSVAIMSTIDKTN